MDNIQTFGMQNTKIMIDGVAYLKLQEIGQGSEGIIYKGENIQTKEIVAIKEYKKIYTNEEKAIQAILQNNCSHIIGIKGIQHNQQQCLIIVMEFAHGEFYKFMKTLDYQKLDYQQKNNYFVQMVQGVNQLHEMGLFHRDLKPENFVYINQPNQQKIIKLIDFGLVKETSNQMAKTSCVGTPFYIAPDVLQSNQNISTYYDKSVDVWSLGAIWYEILTEETFFNGISQQDIFNQIMYKTQNEIDQQIQYNQKIQQQEKNFIKRMLRRSSIQRLQLREIIETYNQQPNFNMQNKLQYQNQNQQQIKQIQPQFNLVKSQFNQVQNQFNLVKSNFNQVQNQFSQVQPQFTQIQPQVQPQFNQITFTECQEKNKINRQFFNQQSQLCIEENQRQKKEIEDLNKKFEEFKRIQVEAEQKIRDEYQQKLLDLEIENNEKIQSTKREIKKEQQEEIKQKVEEQKMQMKQELEIEISKKYMQDYSIKVTQLEKTQEQEKQLYIQDKIQSLFQFLQNSIQLFTKNLDQKLQIIKNIDSLDPDKEKLVQLIQSQIQKNNEKIQINEQKQLQLVSQIEQLKGLDNQLALQIQQNIEEQNNFILYVSEQQIFIQNQIDYKQQLKQQQQEQEEQEEQIDKEKQDIKNKFQKLKQQSHQYLRDIKIFQERMKFYERIQYQIYQEEKLYEIVEKQQRMIQDLQVLEQYEKTIIQIEKSKQLINYQDFNKKLEQLLQSQNIQKNLIEETSNSLEQIDSKFVEENKRQISFIAQNLNYFKDQFKLLSQNEQYVDKITQINFKIEGCFDLLNDLNLSLEQKGIFLNYQQFQEKYQCINQNLQEFKQQYYLLLEQIHNDQQIKQRNDERLKKLKIVEGQLIEFVDKMNQLKIQVSHFSKDQYCDGELSKNLIMDKQQKIDQNIQSIQQQYEKFSNFQISTCFETMNLQIVQLEQFQEKLKQLLLDEQDKVQLLDLVLQKIANNNKSEQEKEYFQLYLELQQLYFQFSRTLSSVKIDQDKIDQIQLMNEKGEALRKELEQEKERINNYYNINQQNQKLFLEQEKKIFQETSKRETHEQILQLLNKLSEYDKEKMKKINEVHFHLSNNVIYTVDSLQIGLGFQPLDNTLIDTQYHLQQEEQLVSQEINLIRQVAQIQQLNPLHYNDLKEKMQNLIKKINELILKIPQNKQFEYFNSVYKINLESFEKLYSLINYLKLCHLTLYYERVKENKQKKNLMESNGITFYKQKINQKMEEDIEKKEQAQNLLQIYENIIFHNFHNKRIEELQKDYKQISMQILEKESFIKSKNQAKLRDQIKNLDAIQQIIKIKQYESTFEFPISEVFKILKNTVIVNKDQSQNSETIQNN
ncbi:unnamed protein product [Paramecium sonneborni]|uniref:non-specific serine/threonine protein kinase n=1 Tax=Paramecium sonneborni TaxID=65129 RepID=A0A8S1L8I7_9CILI|nr:unnamed protein product [Paramecium sonneborni]